MRRERESAARSSYPFLTYQRGDSGRINMPTERTKAHTNWMEIGIRYEEWFGRFWVELFTTDASRRPIVMAHW